MLRKKQTSDNSSQRSCWPVKPVAERRAFGSLEDVQAIVLQILGHFFLQQIFVCPMLAATSYIQFAIEFFCFTLCASVDILTYLILYRMKSSCITITLPSKILLLRFFRNKFIISSLDTSGQKDYYLDFEKWAGTLRHVQEIADIKQ